MTNETMSCKFHVGQKVVCVDGWAHDGSGYGYEIGPVKGQVYTIRNIGFLNATTPDVLVVRLSEIRNPEMYYRGTGLYEPSFRASRFRPVVARKTDISVFKAMLKPSKKRVPA
jgi:hypothetical protein